MISPWLLSCAVTPEDIEAARAAGFTVALRPPVSVEDRPDPATRKARITAAARDYLEATAGGPGGRTYGVLKAICLRHGVNPSSVTTRLKKQRRRIAA